MSHLRRTLLPALVLIASASALAEPPSFAELQAYAREMAAQKAEGHKLVYETHASVSVDAKTIALHEPFLDANNIEENPSTETKTLHLLFLFEDYRRAMSAISDRTVRDALQKAEAGIREGPLSEVDLRRAMKAAVRSYGERRNLKWVESYPILPAYFVPVTLTTVPAGGTVYLMKKLQYLQCLKLRSCGPELPWRMASSPEGMSGTYRYRVKCPGPGGRTLEGDINADEFSKLPGGPQKSYTFQCGLN